MFEGEGLNRERDAVVVEDARDCDFCSLLKLMTDKPPITNREKRRTENDPVRMQKNGYKD